MFIELPVSFKNITSVRHVVIQLQDRYENVIDAHPSVVDVRDYVMYNEVVATLILLLKSEMRSEIVKDHIRELLERNANRIGNTFTLEIAESKFPSQTSIYIFNTAYRLGYNLWEDTLSKAILLGCDISEIQASRKKLQYFTNFDY